MYQLLLAALGLGIVAVASRQGKATEPPGPGPLAPGELGTVPAVIPLKYIGATTVLFKVKASKVIPKVKYVPADLKVALPDAICDYGGSGISRVPPTILEHNGVAPPSNVHGSWGLYTWCVANVVTGTLGLPGGLYLTVWQQNGAKLVFGPFDAYVQVGARPTNNLAAGLKKVLQASVSSAKGWAI